MSKYNVYFGTYSNSIFYGEFDSENGDLKMTGTTELENPSYLYLPHGEKILYAVSEKRDGEVASVDLETKKIASRQKTNGASPCHLCAQDKFLFAANYSEGTLSVFDLDNDGKILKSFKSIAHYGKGANPNRQEKSHVHFVNRYEDYLAVCDLGLDRVIFYPYNDKTGISVTGGFEIVCPDGMGPRHIDFTHSHIYVLTEMGNKVLVYDKKHNLVQEISTLPADFDGKSTAAAVHISPDGKFLAASNRGHDSIIFYRINPDNGLLDTAGHIKTNRVPRDFAFSPDGKWILCGSETDNTLTVYEFNGADDIKSVKEISIPSPICVLFGDKI
ncbi:MAG: lactonase family protein [Oscillospiraceae bacterium]|nr:lactonase family protein [Oscillospiraceae bacterium]